MHRGQKRLIKEMMSVLEKGGKLDEQKIRYIADLSDRGYLVQGSKMREGT